MLASLKRARCGAFAAAILTALGTASASGAPGELDPSFAPGGHARVQVNQRCLRGCVEFAGSYANALALQPNGDIVLAGSENYIGTPQFPEGQIQGALVRLLPDGELDPSFGSAGIEGTPFDVTQIDANAGGGLVAIGSTEAGRLGVSRYTPAGMLDGGFGQQGVRWMPRPTGSVAVHRDSRGRIVVLAAFNLNAVDVVRYLSTGALDRGFGHGGYLEAFIPNASGEAVGPSEAPPQAKPTAMALQPNGGIYVAFEAAPFHASGGAYWPSEYFLEHLTPSGRLDRAFGRQGLVSLRGEATAMAVAPTGHLFAAWADPPLGRRPAVQEQRVQHLPLPPRRLALAEYTPSGQLDRTFGRRGIALSRLLGGPRQAGLLEPHAVGFDQASEPIVVGDLPEMTIDVPAGVAFLARYTQAGLDCSFGDGGIVFDPELGGASALAIQSNGRILVAGWSGKAFAVARYLGGRPRRTCSS